MSSTERIFALIEEKGVTASKVAEATGISKGNFTDWKKGRANPGYGALVKLSHYFRVPVKYLKGETDQRTPMPGDEEDYVDPDDIRFALHQEIRDMTDEMLEDVLRFARFVRKERE